MGTKRKPAIPYFKTGNGLQQRSPLVFDHAFGRHSRSQKREAGFGFAWKVTDRKAGTT